MYSPGPSVRLFFFLLVGLREKIQPRNLSGLWVIITRRIV